ncbi:TetR family transcriptional regulator [Nocardia mexicana]|uniref:TetR family transcriptional regulator n=2 Tax=Nocardia mexicana TaxID=279262 RepID=A0A370HGN1_9NOCA|nr:TetR family transcriptional regulator [Nocardia mexicana]
MAEAFAPSSLPRGRHRLSREDVASSQRGRLCIAAFDLAAEKGYHAVTVIDLVKAAGVSKRTFYELFDSIDECFGAALEVCVDVAVDRITDAVSVASTPDGPPDWRSLLDISIRTYLETLAAEPNAAKAMHVEIMGAGPVSAGTRFTMVRLFGERMRALHSLAVSQDPTIPQPPPEAFDFFVDGLDGRMRHHLRTQPAATLPELTPLLAQCAMALFGKPEYTNSPPAT